MKTSDAGRKFIESWEGCYLHAYRDSVGVVTIGYGHTNAAGPPRIQMGDNWNQALADDTLSHDLGAVELDVDKLIKVPLNQAQFDALVSFQYNTGWLAHPGCSLRNLINAREFELAAKDFHIYDLAGGHVLAGLLRRREAEAAMFATGEYRNNV
jgi:lysozyme